MKRILILIADGARARFFRPESVPRRGSPDAVRLREIAGLVNPAGELTSLESLGEDRAPRGGGLGYDDDRAGHFREVERRFVREIARATADFARRGEAEEVLAAVSPHLLGALRQTLAAAVPREVEVKEFAADISWHTPQRIQDFFSRHGALAAAGS
ncbi:MAG TPA: host attachment protein [Polyangiaceae bacterium]|nr:host attachment protein [Polyangiaceae bacterium]